MQLDLMFMSQKWQVRWAAENELVDCVGLCDPRTNTITIDPGLPRSVMIQTMFHEIVHLWEITLAQNLTEQQVDVLATAMLHFFTVNPEMTEFFKDSK